MEGEANTDTSTPQAEAATDSPILLDVKQVAAMLNCSWRHVYRMADAGKMPRPVKLGSLVRWNRIDVETWVSEGCQPPSNGRRRKG